MQTCKMRVSDCPAMRRLTSILQWQGRRGEKEMARKERGGGDGKEGEGRRRWQGRRGEEEMARKERGGGDGKEGEGKLFFNSS